MVVNLDCAAFKRGCGAEPQAVIAQPNLMTHQANCVDCADFYQEMLALDVQMSAAFSLPVAQNSIDEQLSSVTYEQHENVVPLHARNKKSSTKNRRFAWMSGAAASVMLASFLFVGVSTSGPTFADEVIEHIHEEPGLLILTEAMHSQEHINMVLKQANVSMNDSNIHVLAAKLCPLNGQLAAHLVIEGESGQPVTLMILPSKDIDTKSGSIDSNEFNGRIITAEHGAIAVIGGKRENVKHLGDQVSDAIQWLN